MKSIYYKFVLVLIISFLTNFTSLTTNLFAETKSVKINTTPHKIRSQYPFPEFLSTGPYFWYENAQNKPIKGYTYRIATFTEDQITNIFLEYVEFGIGGCCLEIKKYRELNLGEAFFREHFPEYTGKYGFKLIRWINSGSFEFQAYGGTYIMSELGAKNPRIINIVTSEED